MSPFGVAVIGIGGVAANHLRAVANLADARLVGVADLVPERARVAAVTAGPDVRWTDSAAACLSWPDVDGVILSTPNDTHVELGLDVLGARRHLLVEKPMALDLAGADRLIELADRHDLVLMPGHTQRFYTPARAVKRAIDDGDIGPPTFARASILAGWIWGGWGSWVLDPARSGGHILHNGVHGIDLVTWWLGSAPVEVQARGYRGASGLDIDDHFTIAMRHASGAVAAIEVSRAVRPRSLVIRESVVAGPRAVVRILPSQGEGVVVNEAGSVPLGFDAQAGFDREVGGWIAAARDRVAPPVTAAEGRQALAASVAAQRSLELERPVVVGSVG